MSFEIGEKVIIKNRPEFVYTVDEITGEWIYFTKSRYSAGRGYDYAYNVERVIKPGQQLLFNFMNC